MRNAQICGHLLCVLLVVVGAVFRDPTYMFAAGIGWGFAYIAETLYTMGWRGLSYPFYIVAAIVPAMGLLYIINLMADHS